MAKRLTKADKIGLARSRIIARVSTGHGQDDLEAFKQDALTDDRLRGFHFDHAWDGLVEEGWFTTTLNDDEQISIAIDIVNRCLQWGDGKFAAYSEAMSVASVAETDGRVSDANLQTAVDRMIANGTIHLDPYGAQGGVIRGMDREYVPHYVAGPELEEYKVKRAKILASLRETGIPVRQEGEHKASPKSSDSPAISNDSSTSRMGCLTVTILLITSGIISLVPGA